MGEAGTDETQFTQKQLFPDFQGLTLSLWAQLGEGEAKRTCSATPRLWHYKVWGGLWRDAVMGSGQSLCPFNLGHARDKGLQKEHASNTISHQHDERDDLSLSESWFSKKERTHQAKQGKHCDSSPGSPRRHVGGWSGANCLVPGASRQRKWLELQTSLQKQDRLEGHRALSQRHMHPEDSSLLLCSL